MKLIPELSLRHNDGKYSLSRSAFRIHVSLWPCVSVGACGDPAVSGASLWKGLKCYWAHSVTVLPSIRWRAASGLQLIASSLTDHRRSDSSPVKVGKQRGSHLSSRTFACLFETRCDEGVSEIKLVSVLHSGQTRLSEIETTGSTSPSDELRGVFIGVLCSFGRVGSWYTFSQPQSAEQLEAEEINTFHF